MQVWCAHLVCIKPLTLNTAEEMKRRETLYTLYRSRDIHKSRIKMTTKT